MSAARVPDPHREKDRLPKYNPKAPIAEQILGNAQESREVIQDFVPLADSLEWELGQQYLKDRGNKAFISDASPVPFVINNDGNLSRNAADVFFTNLVEAEKAGTLEPDIFVLELGIGVGLFARYFLDNLQELCAKHKKDYYERLCYIAADKSERMLLDVCRHGVLANHPGRYRLRVVDALEPAKDLPHDVAFLKHGGKPFRAVFLNYLLDCLPAAVLEIDGDQVRQLCVRTCVARNIQLAAYTDMSLEHLQQRAKSDELRAKQELLEVYGLFASEYDYRPVDYKTLPHGEFGYEYARRWAKRLLLSYGAITCLEKLLGLVHDQGFILANDYGPTQLTTDDEFEHQRFSLATFVGVNFPLLKAYFTDPAKCEWVEPAGEAGDIHSRLLGRDLPAPVKTRFQEKFGKGEYEKMHEPVKKARECLRVGRFELAATYYNQALERQPRNWVLLNEVSIFLTFPLQNPKAGSDMAKVALGLNPTCSAELWNTLGDSLFEFGRTDEAASAYRRALQINETDARARYNLAWVYQRQKNYPAALQVIAEALGMDKTGEYRDRLLQKLNEVVAQQVMRHQHESLLLINLISKYAKQEDKPKPERGAATGPESWERQRQE